ncbi:MAG TPA: rRNA maturation RNase YbeY [Bryobacteraceae bacterium]|nr:rRNA maturation RNase YbeY [Bryobacteraceae bacterium]
MSPDDPHLLFRHRSRRVRRKPLGEFLAMLEKCVARGRGVTCLISTDAELRRLNRQFRGKNYAADVLSFPPAEIAISLDRAAAQAEELGHSLDEELRILMLHGMLHLCGMDHETDSGQMLRAETRWRKRLGLPFGLIERAQ